MKLNIGDYVRTNYGTIVKIEAIDEEVTLSDKGYIDKENIIKSSPNIIDLIEVGDYVNGKQVYVSRYGELYTAYVYCGGIVQRTTESYVTFIDDMEEDDIETIVTKEQFESMEYKL